MSTEAVDRAVERVEARHPGLGGAAQAVAGGLTAGEGIGTIHQARLQEYLWYSMPRDHLLGEWPALVEGAGALLDELGLRHLAEEARSDVTASVLEAWRQGYDEGAAAFRAAHARSGVQPPDTPLLTWGSIMGVDEHAASDAVERALGVAVADGGLVPGAPRWKVKAAAICEATLLRPLDLPPGQTMAGMVVTERIGSWIDEARHPELREWRSSVANRLLHPIEPPTDAAQVVAPVRWLLELAGGSKGAQLTQSGYLARADVVEAVERFDWWDWPASPRSESEVHQLATVRAVATRLRLVRRRGRRLVLTARGAELLAAPGRLWERVAVQTERSDRFAGTVAEVVGLRLLRGRVTHEALEVELTAVLAGQGWRSSDGPITVEDVGWDLWSPLRWWLLLGVVDHQESTWEYGTGRQLTPAIWNLTGDGDQTVLAYLRSRAAGPRHRVGGG